MSIRTLVLLVVGVALTWLPVSVAQAQDFGFRQGEFSLTLGGSGSNDSDANNGGFNVNGNLGYFVADQLELSIRQSYGYSDFGTGSSWTGATRVGIDYYFDFDRFQPFIGASIGYLYGDQFDDTFAAGPEAGLRFLVNETTFIYASVAYEFFFENASNASDAFEDGQFVYNLGIGFTW